MAELQIKLFPPKGVTLTDAQTSEAMFWVKEVNRTSNRKAGSVIIKDENSKPMHVNWNIMERPAQ